MESGLLITIYLKGKLSGPVSHTTKQIVKVDVSKKDDKHPKWDTRKILHTDRTETLCYKKLVISEDIVNVWCSECPFWERQPSWKSMKSKQKIESYVNRFDEGYGVSYELLS